MRRPPRRPKGALRPVGALLPELIQELGLAARRGDAEVLSLWPQLVGPAIAKAARPLGLRDGVLELGVVGAAWAAELKLLEGPLLAKLAARVGPGRVRALKTKVVGKAQVAKLDPEAVQGPPELVGPPWSRGSAVGAASPEARARWAEASLKISDPKLAHAVARAGAALADLQAARQASGARPCPRCGAPCDPEPSGLPRPCSPCLWAEAHPAVRPDTAEEAEAT